MAIHSLIKFHISFIYFWKLYQNFRNIVELRNESFQNFEKNSNIFEVLLHLNHPPNPLHFRNQTWKPLPPWWLSDTFTTFNTLAVSLSMRLIEWKLQTCLHEHNHAPYNNHFGQPQTHHRIYYNCVHHHYKAYREQIDCSYVHSSWCFYLNKLW